MERKTVNTRRPVKAALSFFGIFIGWCVAIITLVCWQVFAPGFGYVTDFSFFLFWPALFGFIGWLIFVLPAVYLISDGHWLLRLPFIVATGAVYGICVYLVLVCTWLTGGWTLVWFPAIMGGIGGAVYSLLLRWQILARFRTGAAICFFLMPLALLLLFALVVWPFVIDRFPYTAYVFGDYQSRDQAHLRILKSIRRGDTYSELHRKYPRIFTEPFLSQSGGGTHYTYSISFDETATSVKEIEIGDRP